MIQGTTPTHKFTLPFVTDIVQKARIIYAQCERVIFTKETPECECDGNTITVKLTQEDTLSLNARRDVQIQVKVLTNDGSTFVSAIKTVNIDKCLDREVLE